MRYDDDDSFIEKDSSQQVVATYDAWHHMPTPKSFSASSEYRKFSPDGELIEEVN